MSSFHEPRSYTVATAAERQRVVNGCGPAAWKFDLLPDSILDVNIAEVCNIHDWQYEHGTTEADRLEADDLMLKNMRVAIRRRGGLIMWWRLLIARIIHRALRRHGAKYFFSS